MICGLFEIHKIRHELDVEPIKDTMTVKRLFGERLLALRCVQLAQILLIQTAACGSVLIDFQGMVSDRYYEKRQAGTLKKPEMLIAKVEPDKGSPPAAPRDQAPPASRFVPLPGFHYRWKR